MERFGTLLVLVFVVSFCACFACSSSSNNTPVAAGISIKGVASSMPVADQVVGLKAMPSGCPDDQSGGVALNVNPVDNSFMIATEYVRLLKQGSLTEYYEIPACTHATAAEAEAAAVIIGSSTTTICELDTAIPTDALATYDGIEMAIYYVQMTVPMIVPELAPGLANYPLRIYFNDDAVNGVLARDILIFAEVDGKWGWVNWDDMTALTYLGEPRPASLLDAFANDLYWCADCTATPELCPAEPERRQCSAGHPTWSYKSPVTISTRDTSGGTNFTLDGSFTIGASTEAHTVTMAFNLVNTLTAWSSQAQIDVGDTDIDIAESCGFHPLFPSVTITDSKE